MAGDQSEPQIIDDCVPLLEAAGQQKELGNAAVKRKAYHEAIAAYNHGIAILDKADGHPILRSEGLQMVTLKATLYSNIAQCCLSQELYRRAIEAADSCLQIDPEHSKALFRRSLAFEALRSYGAALQDVEALKALGGGGLSEDALSARLAELQKKQAEVERLEREEQQSKAEDPMGMAMVNVKESASTRSARSMTSATVRRLARWQIG
ncbi:unnamed protein product [Effrenium voratum]|nr:unnamed protein product [Effrenium voratum]